MALSDTPSAPSQPQIRDPVFMAAQENENLKLEDGRDLSYAIYGSPVPRKTVIYMHGWPSSRFEGKLWHTACVGRGVRLIAPDRPGTGPSTFKPNRKMLDWPADVLELVDHLKIKQFYILGVSGGAPYALACVKCIPKERLLGVTLCSGLYPSKLGLQGMMIQTRIMFAVAPWSTYLLTLAFEAFVGKNARNKDQTILEVQLRKEMEGRPAKDIEAVLEPNVWPIMVAMSRESFLHGSEGQSWEAYIYGSDWGFELGQLYVGDIGVPLKMWHGTDDINVPANLARRAKELMPGSELILKEGDYHFNYVFRDVEGILDGLLGQEEGVATFMMSE